MYGGGKGGDDVNGGSEGAGGGVVKGMVGVTVA